MDSEQQGLMIDWVSALEGSILSWESVTVEERLKAVDYKKINRFCAFALGIYADTDRMSCDVDFDA